jgi:hypothetical protein
MHDPAPTSLDEVLDPSWLTEALSARYPGVKVIGAEAYWEQKNVATKVRFRIEVDPMPAPPPPNWCVKAYFGRPDRFAAGEREGEFYRELAPKVPITVPTCEYVGTNPETGHTLILMHDLTAAGTRFLTALSPYTVDLAAATLEELARLHGGSWADESMRSVPWLDSRLRTVPDYIPADTLQSLIDSRRGDPLPGSIKDAVRLGTAMRTLGEADEDGPICLTHGDAHAGNVFLEESGQVGIIDWQVVHRGSWAGDVAYHIGAVLDVEERERSERDLLTHYLDRLAAHGGQPPSPDDAWTAYRKYLVYGYFFWAMTRFVDEEITVEFTKRLGTAVAQHDSFSLLGV